MFRKRSQLSSCIMGQDESFLNKNICITEIMFTLFQYRCTQLIMMGKIKQKMFCTEKHKPVEYEYAKTAYGNGGGQMHHLFIYLFIYQSNRMVVLLLCQHFTALCTFKNNISASCYSLSLNGLFSSLLYRQHFIGFSCGFGGLFYSLHFSLLPLLQHTTTRRQFTVGMRVTLPSLSLFLQVSSNYSCCEQESPVPKLGIIN